MYILWLILKILSLYLLLRGVMALSYKYLFLKKKMILWLFIMLSIGFLLVLSLYRFENAASMIGWSAFITLATIIPNSHKSREEQDLMQRLQDSKFKFYGLNNGRRRLNWGFALFIIGIVAGWLIFLTQKSV